MLFILFNLAVRKGFACLLLFLIDIVNFLFGSQFDVVVEFTLKQRAIPLLLCLCELVVG